MEKVIKFICKKRSYAKLVLLILMAISYFSYFKVFFEYQFNLGMSGITLHQALVAKAYDVVSIWIFGSVFIVIGFSVDIIPVQSRIFSLTSVDFINSKELYRDLLNKYSAMSLAYIDDFSKDPLKYVVITALELELKNKITINDNGVEVIDKSVDNLYESERYILNNVKRGRIFVKDSSEFLELAKKECIEYGLVEENAECGKPQVGNKIQLIIKGIVKVLVYLAILFGIIVGLVIFGETDFGGFTYQIHLAMLFLLAYLPIGLFLNYVAYHQSITILSFRTKKGEEVNTKIEGLKNYIKRYSLLKDREKEQLLLWDDYLIYSVMFNENKKVIDEINRHIVIDGVYRY